MLLPAAEADAETTASDFVIKDGKLENYKGKDVNVTIPDDVKTIGAKAFAGNTTIEKITLSDSVKQIEAYAFVSLIHICSCRRLNRWRSRC